MLQTPLIQENTGSTTYNCTICTGPSVLVHVGGQLTSAEWKMPSIHQLQRLNKRHPCNDIVVHCHPQEFAAQIARLPPVTSAEWPPGPVGLPGLPWPPFKSSHSVLCPPSAGLQKQWQHQVYGTNPLPGMNAKQQITKASEIGWQHEEWAHGSWQLLWMQLTNTAFWSGAKWLVS